MKFTSVATLALVAVAEIANATPVSYSEDSVIVTGLGKRQDRNPITGVRKGYSGGYRVYRQEIRELFVDKGGSLAANKPGRVMNLFLQALERMQARPASDPNSYWQIAAIHGRPYQPWNNDPARGNTGTGYCTHMSTLFPTWHRPYLALIEQVIYRNAEAIVAEIPSANSGTRKLYNEALLSIRMPYWDWAANADMPQFIRDQSIQVTRWNGRVDTISNPLAKFRFQGGMATQSNFPSYPFYQWSETKRWPTNIDDPNAASQNDAVNQQMNQNGASLRQRVYQVLVNGQFRDWSVFSHKTYDSNGNPNGVDSLESIHDVIHGLTGNGGHMAWVDYSSFDPIFWFHHTNIDRIFAIWQAINPHNYVTPLRSGGTFGVPPNTVEDANTPLTPFRGLNGQYWTSNSVRDTSTFGYGYRETPKWKYRNRDAAYASYVRGRVNALYGSTNRALAASAKRKRDVADVTNSTEVALDKSVQNHQYNDWKVNVFADRTALGGSFFVHIFLGTPDANPALWSSQKELVGDYVIFTSHMVAAPGIDATAVSTKVAGTVPLTQALIDHFADSGLDSLDPADVIPYLKENLHWRVSLMNDTSYAVDQVRDLNVTVARAIVTVPLDDENGTAFPEFGSYENVPDVIASIGKKGGDA